MWGPVFHAVKIGICSIERSRDSLVAEYKFMA